MSKWGNTKAPRIIGGGDFCCMDPLIIAAEGVEVIRATSPMH